MRLLLSAPLALVAACGGSPAGPASSATRFERAAQGIVVRQSPIAVAGGSGRLIAVEIRQDLAVEVVPATRPAPLRQIVDAARERSCVAVNGGFYDYSGAMGWVVHNGDEVAPLRQTGGSGVLTIADGRLQIRHREAVSGRPREALQSIDRLVDNGRSLVGANARPDPDARSAVALRSDGTVIFAVVFADEAIVREAPSRVELGPASSTTGLSLSAWAELLARPVAEGGLGATTALNLDGGYSTSLAIHVGDIDLDVVAHRATINALRACAG